MSALVTIAIPTYSRLAYLKEAVAAALEQTHHAIEVLIGDDGSTTEIPAWAKEMEQQHRRVRYQKNARNLGLAGNWNALAEAARGEFVVIIGDDDRLLPEFTSRLLAAAGDANVAFANHYLIDSAGRRLEAESRAHTVRYQRDVLKEGPVADAESCVWRNSVPMSSALIRTADARRLRFREELNTPEIEFFLRLAREGGRFVFVPDYLCEYRVHAQSATTAGLKSEELADCLLPFPASASAELCKREFMGPLLVNAVSRCMLRGEAARARRYLASEYYPRDGMAMARVVQKVCARLPGVVGGSVYRAVHALKGRWSRSVFSVQ
ncbi:MAG: glycosyltransferase family 2 protein [Verrucomicrobiota bacterium]